MFRNYQVRQQQIDPWKIGIVRIHGDRGLITSHDGLQYEYAAMECDADVKLGDRVSFRVLIPQSRHGLGVAGSIKRLQYVD